MSLLSVGRSTSPPDRIMVSITGLSLLASIEKGSLSHLIETPISPGRIFHTVRQAYAFESDFPTLILSVPDKDPALNE